MCKRECKFQLLVWAIDKMFDMDLVQAHAVRFPAKGGWTLLRMGSVLLHLIVLKLNLQAAFRQWMCDVALVESGVGTERVAKLWRVVDLYFNQGPEAPINVSCDDKLDTAFGKNPMYVVSNQAIQIFDGLVYDVGHALVETAIIQSMAQLTTERTTKTVEGLSTASGFNSQGQVGMAYLFVHVLGKCVVANEQAQALLCSFVFPDSPEGQGFSNALPDRFGPKLLEGLLKDECDRGLVLKLVTIFNRFLEKKVERAQNFASASSTCPLLRYLIRTCYDAWSQKHFSDKPVEENEQGHSTMVYMKKFDPSDFYEPSWVAALNLFLDHLFNMGLFGSMLANLETNSCSTGQTLIRAGPQQRKVTWDMFMLPQYGRTYERFLLVQTHQHSRCRTRPKVERLV